MPPTPHATPTPPHLPLSRRPRLRPCAGCDGELYAPTHAVLVRLLEHILYGDRLKVDDHPPKAYQEDNNMIVIMMYNTVC